MKPERISRIDYPIKSTRVVRTLMTILNQAYKRRRAHDNSDDVVELSQPSYKASWSHHKPN